MRRSMASQSEVKGMTIEDGNAAQRDDRSGFEQLQALAKGEYPASPMNILMPFKTLPPKKGSLKFESKPDATHLNGFGAVHGGWAMTMLDNAMGLAAHSMVEAGEFCPSMETSVKFLDKICVDDQVLTITAEVMGQEGRKFLIEGAIKTKDGTELATGKSTCILIRSKEPKF